MRHQYVYVSLSCGSKCRNGCLSCIALRQCNSWRWELGGETEWRGTHPIEGGSGGHGAKANLARGGWGEVRILMGKILESVGLTEVKWTVGEEQGG